MKLGRKKVWRFLTSSSSSSVDTRNSFTVVNTQHNSRIRTVDAAVQLLHVRSTVWRCTSCPAGTKSLPDTLRIAGSSMTSL